MQISSPAFGQGQPIPKPYTCYGQGVRPSLQISDVPEAAQSLAIYAHDPDSPGGDFVHWIIWNISAATTTLPAHHKPSGSTEGMNDFGKTGWGALCPNQGTHRYVFEVYALNSQLDLASGTKAAELMPLLSAHTLSKAELTGTVSAQ